MRRFGKGPVVLGGLLMAVATWMAPVRAATGVLCPADVVCVSDEGCAAMKALSARAGAGDTASQVELGLRLMMGKGVMPDEEKAKAWFEKAALKGHSAAQVALGTMLLREGEKTAQQGRQWLEKAARGGNLSASQELLMLYTLGRAGIPENDALARQWAESVKRQADKALMADVERRVAPYQRIWQEKTGGLSGECLAEAVKRSAAAGDPMAQTLLAGWQVSGTLTGVEENRPEAMERLSRAAEAGDTLAASLFGTLLFTGSETHEGDPVQAEKWLEKAAKSGDVDSMRLLGLLRLHGINRERGATEELTWLEKAAARGDPRAWFSLGSYWNGIGQKEAALDAFEKVASDRKNPEALSLLARTYGNGSGPVAGESEAMREWRRHAGQGDVLAMMSLAMAYDTGVSGRRHLCSAVFWYEKAARHGAEEVFLPLAMACAEAGAFSCARKWLEKAVVQEEGALYSGTVFELAFGAENGPGGNELALHVIRERRNGRKKRLAWLRAEGRRGNTAAAFVLVKVYELGVGVPSDEKQARMWGEKAALRYPPCCPERPAEKHASGQ